MEQETYRTLRAPQHTPCWARTNFEDPHPGARAGRQIPRRHIKFAAAVDHEFDTEAIEY